MTEELFRCGNNSCTKLKPVEEFTSTTGRVNKICNSCRANARRSMERRRAAGKVKPEQIRHNLKQFGLTPEQYDQMLKDQGGKCAICQRIPESTERRLSVDHCHNRNFVRALLCSQCNVGIGMLQHDVSILQAAITYLDKFRDPIDLGG